MGWFKFDVVLCDNFCIISSHLTVPSLVRFSYHQLGHFSVSRRHKIVYYIRFYPSHILTVIKDKLVSVHIPVSPSVPPMSPHLFLFHSSSNPISLVDSSFVKELQSCGAGKTSPPDVQFTWLETDSGASGGDWKGGADWYQLIKETPRIHCFFFCCFFPGWLRQSHVTHEENEASDPRKTTGNRVWGRERERQRWQKQKWREIGEVSECATENGKWRREWVRKAEN